MEGADFLSFRSLWFVLAGFILGFATSTLWEWLYYRGKRLAQTSHRMLETPRAERPLDAPGEASDPETEGPWRVSYRSSGIYLESEQTPVNTQPIPDNPATEAEQQPTTPAPAPATEEVNTPRINPATLATLGATVARSPIVYAPLVRAPVHTRVYNAPQPKASTAPTIRPTAVAATNHNHTQPEIVALDDATAPAVSPQEAEVAVDSEKTLSVTVIADQPEETQSTPPAPPLTSAGAAEDNRGTKHPDDLALIKGVGEAYKRRLYGAGIYTWRQVAESDVELLRRITRAKPNADIAGWRQRARDLAEQYNRWEATFPGPLDDFTRIEGIGAITADTFYKAGICTYEQLASALPDELARIVPAPTVGSEINFDGWIETAERLAAAKRGQPEGSS